MVAPRFGVHQLLEPGQGTEGFDSPVAQIKLSLGNVAGVIRDGMSHVIARHGGDRKDGDGSRTLKINRLFVAGRQLAVEVPGVSAI